MWKELRKRYIFHLRRTAKTRASLTRAAASHKRHGYYCRSKQTGPRSSRKRSCSHCVRAKLRCDSRFPSCSGCSSRQIQCQYDGEALQNLSAFATSMSQISQGNTVTRHDPATAAMNEMSGSIPDSVADNFWSDVLLDAEFLGLSDIPVDAHTDFAPATTETRELMAFQDTFQFAATDLQIQAPDPSSIISPTDLSVTLSDGLSTEEPSRPIAIRRMIRPESRSIALFLMNIIGSFPRMMLRKETFPPFIHPKCHWNLNSKEDELPEMLVNCMTLAEMFTVRTKKTSNLLWRTVRMEYERLWLEHERYSDNELLASVQALLIYAIMRFMDGHTDLENFDIPLLQSLNTISSALSLRIGGGEFKNSVEVEQQSWQDWIFQESRRRVVTVARIMNLAINLDHAISCEPLDGFCLAPLPAKKTLWEAADAKHWRAEFDTTLHAREIFGLSKLGKVLKLQQSRDQIIATPVEWEEWYATADGFGPVVMLASSLMCEVNQDRG
ncbi:hypothetical protein BCR34DRAFT_286370 [Clohesyomyces aquaticus]|uniref:Zn(2)-C6 fungal-type domain-containing protein n=1 Tax=Clohesyomyces aquaticus TaxID=1231657 RepID=A0A1Y1ZSS8_9PLEO|nr:hypothetical protein BCR34DRAFT_286370 [Clohesyomyces aquaticus]